MEREVIVKNRKVHYKIIGSGAPFLILHGWGSSSDRWQKVGELLSEKNFTVVIPDLPGFGKSQEPTSTWNLDNYINWLLEFIGKIPELQREFYLAGHSFGGAVASKFSSRYNQKVLKLFLISSAIVRQRTLMKSIWYRTAKVMNIFSFLPGWYLLRKAAYKYVFRKSDYPYVSGLMKETYLKVISDDLSHAIHFLKVPTVLIWGDRDEYTPIAQAEFIHQQIPESTLVIINHADHSPHIKLPETLAEKIGENL